MRTVDLTIEGVTFKVAPTPMPKLMRAIRLMNESGAESEAAAEALLEAVFWGARRAKAEITLDWLRENVDAHNFPEVAEKFRELNELRARGAEPGEAKPAGEG